MDICKLSKLCKQYDTILQTILSKHAPLLTKTVSERPPTTCMTQEILEAKVRGRRLERVWRRIRYMRDRSRYRVQCNLCNRIMEKANIILENSEDPKKLWKSINNILSRCPAPSLPENLSLKTICEKNLDVLIKPITSIINKSFQEGVFPDQFKKAYIRPMLKKNNSRYKITVQFQTSVLYQRYWRKFLHLAYFPTWNQIRSIIICNQHTRNSTPLNQLF